MLPSLGAPLFRKSASLTAFTDKVAKLDQLSLFKTAHQGYSVVTFVSCLGRDGA